MAPAVMPVAFVVTAVMVWLPGSPVKLQLASVPVNAFAHVLAGGVSGFDAAGPSTLASTVDGASTGEGSPIGRPRAQPVAARANITGYIRRTIGADATTD